MAKTERRPTREGPIGRLLHDSFVVSLVLKAALGVSQLLAALAILIAVRTKFTDLVIRLNLVELQEDPRDRVALLLLHLAQGFSVGAATFYTLYFAAHGVLNLGLAAALAARWRWAYPVSIVILMLFVVYQMYHFAVTHAIAMIVLSVFDVIVILLVWREYRTMRRAPSA